MLEEAKLETVNPSEEVAMLVTAPLLSTWTSCPIVHGEVVATPPPVPPDGVAHVPSPRQKVDADAFVPLLRFPTGRLPVTPEESGNPVAFVSVAADGVPRFGVVNTGDMLIATTPVPVV